MLDDEQAMEEARSWSNLWTGLAISVIAISVLPAALAFAGMGLKDFTTIGVDGYAKLILPVIIGIVLGRALQMRAINTLRRAKLHPALRARK